MNFDKVNELKNESKNKCVMWIDDKMWGYTNNVEKARTLLTTISNKIVEELTEKNPTWVINTVNENDIVKINCTIEGYIYNSNWTEHVIKFSTISHLKNKKEPVNEIKQTTVTPPNTPPLFGQVVQYKEIPSAPLPPQKMYTKSFVHFSGLTSKKRRCD